MTYMVYNPDLGREVDLDNAKEREEAWKAGGAQDYNANVAAGISGYQSDYGSAQDMKNAGYNPFSGNANQPADVQAARKSKPSPVAGYNNYYDWYEAMSKAGGNGGSSNVGMGDVRKDEEAVSRHDNPMVGSTGGDATKAAGLARLMQLWGDPQAAANEVLRSMGMGDYNTGPLANFMRSKAGMLKPAYYLANGSNTAGMNNPDDFLGFAKNFLGSAGTSLGDTKSLVKNALGVGGPGTQSEGWKELLSGVNPQNGQPWLSDDERANWMQSMYQIQNMNSFNPLRDYASRRLEKLPSQFSQEYGAGRLPDEADFMGYIKDKLPGLFGW